MAGARRQPATDLISSLEAQPSRYSFFKAVSILLADKQHHVEEEALCPQKVDGLRFRVAPGLGFPSGDIARIDSFEENGRKVHELTVSFLGLHGPSSPLPSYFVESAAWSAGEESVQQTFNDFFSNRLIWLFYLIWRKYRYDIRYRPGATDQFSEWMFSFIGIGNPKARGKAGIPWAKLLTYLGVVAARTRSADMIAGVLSHAFNVPSISIRELEYRKVEVPEDQRCKLGMMNCRLGQDMTIGRWVPDVAGKFTIVLSNLSFERFRDFLPSGKDFQRIRELVEFLLKDQFAYDLELNLVPAETPCLILGDPRKSFLGWTTFIGQPRQTQSEPIVLQART